MQPLKLKIELQRAPVKIVRKILVPDNINLWQFHLIIQDAMGWENAHLFEFKDKINKPNISIHINDGEEYGMGMMPQPDIIRNPDQGLLHNLFVEINESKPFYYWYDFGDDWMHKISFLKASKKDLEQFNGVPLCIEAHGACPPEDIGGVWGYAVFLEIINDKRHPQYKELRDWTGLNQKEHFDPTHSSVAAINAILEKVMEHENWNDCPQSIY